MTHETEENKQIKLQIAKEILANPNAHSPEIIEKAKRVVSPKFRFSFHKPFSKKAKIELFASGLIFCLLISYVAVMALTPVTSVTSSNLVMLNGSNTLQSYDGTINIGLGNLGNVQFIGLIDGQVLAYNVTTGYWQNGNKNTYSMANLTDANYVGLTNGDIATWNSTSSKWYNAQPFSASWNASVNQLIGLYNTLAWSQIVGANTQVNSLISTYLSTNAPYLPNSGVGSYSYLISTFTNATNTYYQALNGTNNQIVNSWTSTNQNTVTTNVFNALTYGTIVFQNLQFNTSLTIPSNVLVIQYYQGQETRYTSNYQGGYTITPTGASQAPYISGWNYPPLQLTIAQSSSLSADNQFAVTLHYGYGLNGNASFFLQNAGRTDFGDARFLTLSSYRANSSTLWLPQWNQTYYASDNTTVWFRDPDNLYAQNSIVYLYTGNPSATNPSNEAVTFKDVISNVALALPMKEGTGTTAYDKSGNGNNGVYVNSTNNIQWVQGLHGNALQFVNTGGYGYLNCGNGASTNLTTMFTLEAWIKTSQATVDQAIISRWATTSTKQYIMSVQGNTYETHFSADGSTTQFPQSVTYGYPSSWTNVIITYNSSLSSNQVTLYVNGTSVNSANYALGVAQTASKLTIGTTYADGTQNWALNATLDGIAILSTVPTFNQCVDWSNPLNYGDATLDTGKILVRTYIATQPTITATDTGTFSIIQISDTQYLTSDPANYNALANWIVQQSSSLNLKMVIHTGDIVDDPTDITQWTNANAAMIILQNANIPYCWNAGNHDQNPLWNPNTNWLGSNYAAFNVTTLTKQPYYISNIENGKNTAVRFTVNNHNFLIINMEYLANSTVIAWATNLLNTYPNDNIIVATHDFLNNTGGYGYQENPPTWENSLVTLLNGYSNVFLTLNGHDNTVANGANMTSVNNREQIFFNRQSDGTDGAATARIYTFNMVTSACTVSTYCVWNSTWLTDQWNQFTWTANLK